VCLFWGESEELIVVVNALIAVLAGAAAAFVAARIAAGRIVSTVIADTNVVLFVLCGFTGAKMCEVDVRFPVKTGAATKAVTELVKQMVSGNTGQIVEVTGSVSVANGFGAVMNHLESLLVKF
jgi:hypothetical protein